MPLNEELVLDHTLVVVCEADLTGMALLAWLFADEELHGRLEEMDLADLILLQKLIQSSLNHLELLSIWHGDIWAESSTDQDEELVVWHHIENDLGPSQVVDDGFGCWLLLLFEHQNHLVD